MIARSRPLATAIILVSPLFANALGGESGGKNRSPPQQLSEGLAGYIHMNVPPPPDGFGYGVSFYATAWPLLERPLSGFQIGLPSTWIIPDNRGIELPLCPIGSFARDHWPERGPSYRDVFQTIEGGLGFWASTQFGCATAKYRMNGTTNCYTHEISSPLFGFGRPDALAPDQMGIAQLTNRLLVPPDGLTFERDTCGELFGNAWMALPLVGPRPPADSNDVATGDLSWTLFVNSKNFKGPVAFWIPRAWSAIAKGNANAAGRTLDARAGIMSGGAMEVNTVPRFTASDARGVVYSKIPRLQFPVDSDGRTTLMQDVTMYSKEALFEPFERWATSGTPPGEIFPPESRHEPECSTDPIELRQGPEKLRLLGFDAFAETTMLSRSSFGLKWKSARGMGSFPKYFRAAGKDTMVAIEAREVPAETHLIGAKFESAVQGQPYVSPAERKTVWTDPGPVAGPFTAALSDGSVVTYSWFRFVDQPALRAFAWSDAERARLQATAERIHDSWSVSAATMPPPTRGTLATLDPALAVVPPRGLERGYVPIVTAQRTR